MLFPLQARYDSITFSGIVTKQANARHSDELLRCASDHELNTTGEPLLAILRYAVEAAVIGRKEVLLEFANSPLHACLRQDCTRIKCGKNSIPAVRIFRS